MLQQWLLGEIKSETANAFVASMGMDSDRNFSCVVLGLAVVSPRMGGLLDAIAKRGVSRIASQNVTSVICSTPSKQTTEGGSLQR